MIRSLRLRRLVVIPSLIALLSGLAVSNLEAKWNYKDIPRKEVPKPEEEPSVQGEEEQEEEEETKIPEVPKYKSYRGYDSPSKKKREDRREMPTTRYRDNTRGYREEPRKNGEKRAGFYVAPKIGGFIPRDIFNEQYGGLWLLGVDTGLSVPGIELGLDISYSSATGDISRRSRRGWSFGESSFDESTLNITSIGGEVKFKPPYFHFGGGYAGRLLSESFSSSGSSREFFRSEDFEDRSSNNATASSPYVFVEVEYPRGTWKQNKEDRVGFSGFLEGRYDFDAKTELDEEPINAGGFGGSVGLKLRF